MRRLVLGGARSGKSTWAEQQFVDRERVEYVATSQVFPEDAEWVERVRLHRIRRPDSWTTTETLDLVGVLDRDDEAPVLVDCLAVWLSRVLDEAQAWTRGADCLPEVTGRVDDLCAALQRTRREVILVSNEVGAGIVPADAGSRLYRDELGRLNAKVAAVCDELWVCVAGVARKW